MGTTLTPDICVIGAGSGGLTVAAAAAAFGVSVVLIEKGKMGGDCLNYGCVPSKALIAAGKHVHAINEAPLFGVDAGKARIDFARVHDHVHGVIDAIAPHDSEERFTEMGVTVLREEARFQDETTVVAGETEIKARRFVVATGSSPMVPPIPGLDGVDYLTNENLFDRTKAPDHLIIIGGGPIGMEMAQAHRRLGARVTVLEADRALGKDDPELAAIVLENIRHEGVIVREGAKVTRVDKGKAKGVAVHIETDKGNEIVEGSDVLVAVGRKVNVENIGLKEAGIEHDRKGIKVGKDLRTTNRLVYAVGDVAGGLQFTHVAGYHAGLVVRALLFRLPIKVDRDIIPWATFTDPELANVGLTEEEARKRHGKGICVLRFPYADNDRAQAERQTTGMIKMITTSRGRIVGVGIAGHNAGEMMSVWSLAVVKKLKVSDVASYIPPYPTMAEIGKRAATSYYADFPKKAWVRTVIGFLQKLG